MLDIFAEDRRHIQVQLSRWVKAGKLAKIRREWYLIEKPYRLRDVPLPEIAATVHHPSYLSLEWALQYYEMIPEYVPNPTCVTTERSIQFSAQNRLFIYHHIQPALFSDYEPADAEGQKFPIALPEKALFDKIYIFLRKNRFSLDWLKELRLQNLERLNLGKFESMSRKTRLRGLAHAVERTVQYIEEQRR